MNALKRPSQWERWQDTPGLLGRIGRQWPWVVVLTLVGLGLVLVAVGAWRWGTGVIGAAMVAAGVFRSVVAHPGILVIRDKRWIDLSFYFGVGVATIILAIIVRHH